MKKIFSLIMSFIMISSLFYVPVYAQEYSYTYRDLSYAQEDIVAKPMDVKELMLYGPAILDGTVSFTITPDAGTNLYILARSETNPTIISLRQNGSQVASITIAPTTTSTTRVKLYSGCNGQPYTLLITHYGATVCFIGVYQTEYI